MALTEALEEAIQAGDGLRCEQLLRGLSEAERKKAAPRMAELCKELSWTSWLNLSASEFERRKAQSGAAVVALLGTGSLAQWKRLRNIHSEHSPYGVLADRKPQWLAEWAESMFAREGAPYFKEIRQLIREGVMPRPASDDYIRAFVGWLHEPLENLVRREPEVLEYEIWRIFEVEGDQRASLALVDKYSAGGWAKGLVELAEKGHVPRARLLDASLDALERGFSPFRASWFSTFHEMLRPDATEMEARAARYLGLLGSRAPNTVSFAMKAVGKLEKGRKLDGDAALAMLGPALAARQKGVVTEALKVLASLHKRMPEKGAEIAAMAASALAHESPEVQKLAIDLMEASAARGAAYLARGYEDALAPSQRVRLGVAAAEPVAMHTPAQGPALLTPIGDLNELVEVFAAVLENAGPPEDIERVLDAVSRMCGERTAKFAAVTAPLAARADKFLNTPGLFAITNPFDGRWDPRFCLSALALAWVRQQPVRESKACHGLGSFLTCRVAEVALRAVDGVAKPLAGCPSHSGAWLDPLILVERLLHHPEPERLDLIQALLRLSGDNRPEALERAHSLPGPTGRIVRFALGSDDCRKPPRFFDEALWVAAGQARDPEGGAGVHRLRWIRKTFEAYGKEHERWDVEMESWPRMEMDAALPAALTAAPGSQDAGMLRWCATVWPANRDGWFAAGALALARNLDWDSAQWENRAYLETLATYSGAYGPAAYQLLALGLGCKDAGEGMVATDALVAGLSDARVNGDALGEACAKLAVEGAITISRWVKRFASTAKLNPAFARELFLVQDRILAACPAIGPNELAGFLELLCELREQSGGRLSVGAREHLAVLAPGGKAGKFARTLLEL